MGLKVLSPWNITGFVETSSIFLKHPRKTECLLNITRTDSIFLRLTLRGLTIFSFSKKYATVEITWSEITLKTEYGFDVEGII